MLLSGILLGVSLKRCTCPLVKLGIALEVIYFRLFTSRAMVTRLLKPYIGSGKTDTLIFKT